jgi:hypothetical protein
MIVDDIEILNEHILSAEIFWGFEVVSGTIKIDDLVSLEEQLSVDSDRVLTLYVADLYDDYYTRDFKITGISSTKENNSKITRIEIEDVISWGLRNTYKTNSYSSVKVSDVFKTYYNNLNTDVPLVIDDTLLVKNNYIVPKNVNFYKFIKDELNKEGFIIYQDKQNFYVKNIQNLLPSKLPTNENVLKEVTNNQFYGFSIIEYNISTNKISDVNRVPKTKTLAYNPANKTMVSYDINYDKVFPDISINDNKVALQQTIDEKIDTQEYLTDNGIYNNVVESYNQNNTLNVVVPGNILYNKIWYINDVLLSGNQLSVEGQKNGDVKLSGKYICKNVTDKFVPGQKFIQKLQLVRVDNVNIGES